jgi:hypothetical protein
MLQHGCTLFYHAVDMPPGVEGDGRVPLCPRELGSRSGEQEAAKSFSREEDGLADRERVFWLTTFYYDPLKGI